MAKTAKLKRHLASNPRSRAAKRAASPSIGTDKSLKDGPRADLGPVLHSRLNGGVTKSKKKAKPMKRGQRVRQERGMARAEAVMNRMEKKVEDVQSKDKTRRQRRALWDEVNEASKEDLLKTPRFAILATGGMRGDDEWEDENGQDGGDSEMKLVDDVKLPVNAAGTKLVVVDRTASVSVVGTDDGEIT